MHCRIRRVTALTTSDLDGLAAVLADCVAGGASVGFMQPYSQAQARAWWRGLAADVETGRRALFVAEDDAGIVGTVHLILAQPDNQPHRADLCKMLVLRRARKLGVGAALMDAAESAARAAGKTLLVLDTASADAERLYARMGWQRLGVIPGYALLPDGGPCDTTYFYRVLA
jgi:GNAT superfamily N-acetyltransferase